MNLKDPKTKFLLEVIKSRKYDKYTRKIATEVIASKNNMEVKDVEDYIKFGSVQPTGITRKINLKEDDFRSEAVRLAGRAIKGLDRPHFRTKKKITGMKVMALILLLILKLLWFIVEVLWLPATDIDQEVEQGGKSLCTYLSVDG